MPNVKKILWSDDSADQRSHSRRLAWAGCALSLVLAPMVSADTRQTATEPAYVLGIFPHLTAARIENIFAPIAADMSVAVGRRVILRTRSSFKAFAQELQKQHYDVALIQPFDYIHAHRDYGMIPLARRGAPLSAVIMVHSDAPIYSLPDLKGKVLSLPPETAAVSHLAKTVLVHANLVPGKDVDLRFQRSHDACLQRLLIHRADACGTADYPVRFFQEKMRVSFKQLARSPKIPHVLFAAHPRVDANDREAIKKSILSWPEREAGREIMRKGRLQPFKEAMDKEYDVVRTYWQQIQDQRD